MAKTYVLDTSVILSDYNALFSFPKEEIVLPMTVLKELDGKKKGCDEVARNARESIRILEGISQNGSLKKGVVLENGCIIRVIPDKNVNRALKESLSKDDNIINAAVWLKEKEGKDVELISEDLNMRVIANVAEIPSKAFFGLDKEIVKEEIYSGSIEINVSREVLDEFHHRKEMELEKLGVSLYPNQFVTLKSGKQSGLGMYSKDGFVRKIKEIKKVLDGDVEAKNREQEFALHLLLDEKIELVTLMGLAGCGKTLLSLAACLQQIDKGNYSRLLITKPMVPMGKDLGFLPGSVQEKIAPWMGSIYDNLRFILGDDVLIEDYIQKGKIEFEALTLFRGRSLPNSIILIDEAQNLNRKEVKTLVTRAGHGSKIVMTGDIDQIDSNYTDSLTNGLTYVVEKMKEESISGHITLVRGERSVLATIAAKNL